MASESNAIGKILNYYAKVIKYERVKQVIFQIVFPNHLKIKRLVQAYSGKTIQQFRWRARNCTIMNRGS